MATLPFVLFGILVVMTIAALLRFIWLRGYNTGTDDGEEFHKKRLKALREEILTHLQRRFSTGMTYRQRIFLLEEIALIHRLHLREVDNFFGTWEFATKDDMIVTVVPIGPSPLFSRLTANASYVDFADNPQALQAINDARSEQAAEVTDAIFGE